MKNNNVSNLDISQMQRKMYDEASEAQRVTIVGASDLSSLSDAIEKACDKLSNIKFPELKEPFVAPIRSLGLEPEIRYVEVEKPVIVEKHTIEYREIEKPVIVREVVVETVEVPFIVREVEYKEIEKIVLVEKQMPIPQWVKILHVSQTLVLLSCLIKLFLN